MYRVAKGSAVNRRTWAWTGLAVGGRGRPRRACSGRATRADHGRAGDLARGRAPLSRLRGAVDRRRAPPRPHGRPAPTSGAASRTAERRRDPPGVHRQVRRLDPAEARGRGPRHHRVGAACRWWSCSGAGGLVFALRAGGAASRGCHATDADERLVERERGRRSERAANRVRPKACSWRRSATSCCSRSTTSRPSTRRGASTTSRTRRCTTTTRPGPRPRCERCATASTPVLPVRRCRGIAPECSSSAAWWCSRSSPRSRSRRARRPAARARRRRATSTVVDERPSRPASRPRSATTRTTSSPARAWPVSSSATGRPSTRCKAYDAAVAHRARQNAMRSPTPAGCVTSWPSQLPNEDARSSSSTTARDLLDRAVTADPEFADAHFYRAVLLFDTDDSGCRHRRVPALPRARAGGICSPSRRGARSPTRGRTVPGVRYRPEHDPLTPRGRAPHGAAARPRDRRAARSTERRSRPTAATIVMDLDPSLAPNTVNNFVALARQGYYDGLTFHRVEPQLRDPGRMPRGDGRGGPGYSFDDEPVQGEYTLGAVAMANAGPDTNGSQFFVCIDDCTGKLDEGLQPLRLRDRRHRRRAVGAGRRRDADGDDRGAPDAGDRQEPCDATAGLFGPDSVAWRLHADPVMIVGGHPDAARAGARAARDGGGRPAQQVPREPVGNGSSGPSSSSSPRPTATPPPPRRRARRCAGSTTTSTASIRSPAGVLGARPRPPAVDPRGRGPLDPPRVPARTRTGCPTPTPTATWPRWHASPSSSGLPPAHGTALVGRAA